MTSFIELYWTAGSIDEARKVSRYLVQERFVASAKIIPWIESITMLNNQLDTTQESKVIFITRKELFKTIVEMITQSSKYQVPEISMIEIQDANQVYFEWLKESTSKHSLSI